MTPAKTSAKTPAKTPANPQKSGAPRTRKPKAADKLTEPTSRELEDAATAPAKPPRVRKPRAVKAAPAPVAHLPEMQIDDPIPPTERTAEPPAAPERYRSPETKARAALDARATGVLTHPFVGPNRKARRAARSAERAIRHSKRSVKVKINGLEIWDECDTNARVSQ